MFNRKGSRGVIFLPRADRRTARHLRAVSFCFSVALVVVFAAIAQYGPPGGAPTCDKVVVPAPINQPPNANAQMAMARPSDGQGSAGEAAAMRRKQITDDSSQLLALAIALKTDVDKSNKDTLSVSVIRRADAIEKLARTVKEHMRFGGKS